MSEAINLMPGEYYFGNGVASLKTLLGSCVAVILWHPQQKVGGMCHIVLPDGEFTGDDCNPRYAECAIGKFVHDIKTNGMHPSEFRVGVYGGGRMFSHKTGIREDDVGARNIACAYKLVIDAGFCITDQDVLENKYRHVFLDLKSGETTVKSIEVEKTMD